MFDKLNLLTAAVIGTVIAILAAVVVWFIATAISGDLIVTPPGQSMPDRVPVGVMVPSVAVGGVAGLLLAFAISKLASNAATVFVGTCLVALVLYGAYSFIRAEDLATGIWLNVLHIVAAIPIVGLIRTTLATAPAQAS